MEKYSKEILESVVKESKSYANVLRILNIKQAGGSHSYISRKIKNYDIDTSHFTGQGWNKGNVSNNRKTPDEIFVLLPEGSIKPKRHQLKRALIETGTPYICKICKINPIWNNKELLLEIDHIDRNWLNNLKDNLRFLCPNCHSQE